MRFSTALRYAQGWLDDITVRAHFGGQRIEAWLASGVVDGFECNPLSTEEAICAEAKAPLDRRRWVELWRPYWLAKRRLPSWLPLAPSSKAIRDL